MASEIMVRITKPGALLLFHADGRWHLHDATRGGRVLSGGKPAMLPLTNSKKITKILVKIGQLILISVQITCQSFISAPPSAHFFCFFKCLKINYLYS